MMELTTMFETKQLLSAPDYQAPDGSDIFLLPNVRGGGMCICEMPAGKTSEATCHQTVEEIWFFLEGTGQLWRKLDEVEEVLDLTPGTSVTIPLGCHFQFRNTGSDTLKFVIATMPPWPGAEEAVLVQGRW